MIGFASIEELSRSLAMAVPVAVFATLLLTLAVLLMAKSRRRKSRRSAEDAVEQSTTPSPLKNERDTLAAVTMAMFDATPPTARVQAHLAIAELPPSAAAEDTHLAALAARLKTAGDAHHAAIYLEIAEACGAKGDEAGRMKALRSAAGLAAKHGPAADHARARLALADAAFVAGDLTGACEQWQLARSALLSGGDKDASARIDQRMRDTGCPTDWVLTDF